MYTCEEHGDSVLVYDSYSCPACDYIEELQTEHAKTVEDLEQQINEGDEKIGELESQLEDERTGKE